MRLTRWIALRYLRSKKSHGAVSAIAIISIAGVAIATAAVVCVLSVFNGFRGVLQDKMDALTPDIVVSPAKGKVFSNPDSIIGLIESLKGVAAVSPVVTDKALAIFGGHELPVTIRGIDTGTLTMESGIGATILPGGKIPSADYEEMPDFEYYEDYEAYLANTPLPEVLPAVGTALRLGNLYEGDDMVIFAPKREGRYNPANPMTSFIADSVRVSGIFETHQKEYDEDMMIVPIELARHLFQYEQEASSIEVTAKNAAYIGKLKEEISLMLGEKAVVKDRESIQEVNFRMVNIEKWVSFLLLAFILMIAGFNIISTMTMLVIEKHRQTSVLNAIGMRKGMIGAIFRNESIIVSLIGGVIGIAVGVLLCWIQQEFGVVKLAGDPSKLLMNAYPVRLIWGDVAISFVPCVVLGIITAVISSSFARSRIESISSD